ncbi:unnamed protein product, partial [Meganyctiphanes norvegica]
VLLTDDYFSDITPRSMRRLMNVVYITGRLMKAFHIDFNWYHLASWVNITEQWPYRASWLILYYEANEDSLEDKLPLTELYEKVKGFIPQSRDLEPLLDMDKEEKKLEIFLGIHKASLQVRSLKVFLPFTINLDPFIRKVIKDDQPEWDENAPSFAASPVNYWNVPTSESNESNTYNRRFSDVKISKINRNNSLTSFQPMKPQLWNYGHPPFSVQMNSGYPGGFDFQHVHHSPLNKITLPDEAGEKPLSSMGVEDVYLLLSKLEGLSSASLPRYKEQIIQHNINGRVLTHCDMEDLKKVISMSFGDWELFTMLVEVLREQEVNDEFSNKNVHFQDPLINYEKEMKHLGTVESKNSSAMEGSNIAQQGSSRGSLHDASKANQENQTHIDILNEQNLLAKQGSLNTGYIYSEDEEQEKGWNMTQKELQQWV